MPRFPTASRSAASGVTKNNFYRLYDLGVQGIVNHSKIPLRLATIIGFFSSMVSLSAALVYFVMKMLFWYNLPIGVAPVDHRPVLRRVRAAVLPRHARRICRVDLHAGPQPAAGRRGGTHQLRHQLGWVTA